MEIITGPNEFHTSVERALQEIDPKWREYKGLIVCGSHKPENVEEKLQKIKEAREQGIPFLGICLGHQLAFIERAKNLLGISDATSEEFGQGTFVVRKRPGGLRIGMYPVNFNGQIRMESFWHQYEVNPEFFVKYFPDMLLTDNIDLFEGDNHPFFWTTQFHPEYESSIDKPHPLLVEFINYCKTHE